MQGVLKQDLVCEKVGGKEYYVIGRVSNLLSLGIAI